MALTDYHATYLAYELTETGFSPTQASPFQGQRLGAFPSFSCLSGASTRHRGGLRTCVLSKE